MTACIALLLNSFVASPSKAHAWNKSPQSAEKKVAILPLFNVVSWTADEASRVWVHKLQFGLAALASQVVMSANIQRAIMTI